MSLLDTTPEIREEAEKILEDLKTESILKAKRHRDKMERCLEMVKVYEEMQKVLRFE